MTDAKPSNKPGRAQRLEELLIALQDSVYNRHELWEVMLTHEQRGALLAFVRGEIDGLTATVPELQPTSIDDLTAADVEECRAYFALLLNGKKPANSLPVGRLHDLCNTALAAIRPVETVSATRTIMEPGEHALPLKDAPSAELWVESPTDFLDGWGGKELPPSFHAYAERLYRVYKALAVRSTRQDREAAMGRILLKYIDRMTDPVPDDSLEKIVGELDKDVHALWSAEQDAIRSAIGKLP